jgi:hypothetical protein
MARNNINPNVVNGSFHKGANSVATKTSFSLSAADRFLWRYSPVDQQFSAFSEVMTPMTVVSTIYAAAAKLYNCLLQHRAILPRCQQFAQAADNGARGPVAISV